MTLAHNETSFAGFVYFDNYYFKRQTYKSSPSSLSINDESTIKVVCVPPPVKERRNDVNYIFGRLLGEPFPFFPREEKGRPGDTAFK